MGAGPRRTRAQGGAVHEYTQGLRGGRPDTGPSQVDAAGTPAWTGGLSSATAAVHGRMHGQREVHSSPVPSFPGTAAAPTAAGHPPGLGQLDEELNTEELSLLIKLLTAMGELPRTEIGDPGSRGERLTLWRVAMDAQLKTTRRVVVD